MARRAVSFGILIAAVASLAFAAAASASPVLEEAGTTVPVGTKLDSTSSNLKITNSPFGEVNCTKAELFGELAKNTGTSLAVNGISATSTCVSGKFRVPLTNLKFPSWSTSTIGVGQISTSLTVDTLKVECTYSGNGSFTYVLGSNVIKVSISLIPTAKPCQPEVGSVVLSGEFRVETVSGTAVIIG